MRPASRISIAGLMRLIALFAIELAMFQRVLFLVVIPPVTMACRFAQPGCSLRLRLLPPPCETGSSACSGRPDRALRARGILSAPPIRGTRPFGVGGRRSVPLSMTWPPRGPDPSGPLATLLRLGARSAQVAEIILLDLVGLAIIWVGGWIDSRRRRLCRGTADDSVPS